MDSFVKWLEKKGMKKWFGRDNLLILVLSGILLFIIALPTRQPAEGTEGIRRIQRTEGIPGLQGIPGMEKTRKAGEEDVLQVQAGQGSGAKGGASFLSGEEYCAYLEKRLEEIISGVAGAGGVKVMITLKSSEELVVEKDKQVKRSSVNEQDSQGGSRITNQADTSEVTLYDRTEGHESPYVVKTLLPSVEGVVVVAGGAEKGTVNRNITEMVQALFDIEAHKIKVVKMEAAN